MAAHQFHRGEIGVQTRVGVASTGARVARGIGDRLSDRALDFVNDQRLAIVAGTDARGALWASALRGEPGFLRGLGGGALEIATGFPPGDPLERVFALPAPVGALVIDLAERRRLRVNGTAELKDGVLRVTPSEVFFNCPKYIHPREPPPPAPAGPRRDRHGARAGAARVDRAGRHVLHRHRARRARPRRVAPRRPAGLRAGARPTPSGVPGLRGQRHVPDARQPGGRSARGAPVRGLRQRGDAAALRARGDPLGAGAQVRFSIEHWVERPVPAGA